MNRREFIKLAAIGSMGILMPLKVSAGNGIEHPFKNPLKYTDKEKCDNCGMDRNQWARTRHSFETSKGEFNTCSIHCVAVMTLKLQENAAKVKAAEYFHPENMLDAEKAVYVIGSDAPGTMTSKSKIAFSSEKDANEFVSKHGGKTSGFNNALSEALQDVRPHGHMKKH